MSNDGFSDISFGEGDQNFGLKLNKYKGITGQTDRLSLAWVPTGKDGLPIPGKPPRFIGTKRHFVSGVGYFLAKGEEYAKIAGGPAKEVAATVVVEWPTRGGDLDKARLLTDWSVKGWVFSSDKYTAIKGVHNEFSMQDHDLKVSCTDTKFQKVSFIPCDHSVLAKLAASEKGAAVAKEIMVRVAQVASELRGIVASDMSLAQIRERMAGGSGGGGGGGGGGSAPVGSSVSDADIDDLLVDALE